MAIHHNIKTITICSTDLCDIVEIYIIMYIIYYQPGLRLPFEYCTGKLFIIKINFVFELSIN